ncbi:immunity-related GTPase family M protein-like [Elephas maximus indicus]|uniref:immunity-related GTPase family M protein-like n=1 Tax=Elephas maximus indicus TaxID=99487 RepID=UPI00211654CF|nr:immunity-related GTPase family M protein-like [Elephas maximus indicus]
MGLMRGRAANLLGQNPGQVTPLLTDIEEYPFSASSPSVVPYHMGQSILPEAGPKSMQKTLPCGNLLEVVSVVKDTLKTAFRTPVKMAVTGDSGNGMSSFINALQDIGHKEEASAPTGVVRTTQTRASYLSSSFLNVELWDLPSMGTCPQSVENYVVEMEFSEYDLFIIASKQFSMNHMMLAKTIEGMGKKFYVVWTKLDRDLSTSVLREEQLLKNIQENILENLCKEQVCEPPIFLVSNSDPFLHDFPKLRNTLQMDLIHIRCHGPLQKLSHNFEAIINDKVTSLLERIYAEPFQKTLDNQDPDDSEKCLKTYESLFGVDDESLQLVAQRMRTATTEYKNIMKSQDLQTLGTWDKAISWISCNTAYYLSSIF